MSDQWEGLFKIWHERAHDMDSWKAVGRDMRDLERRIVKLEAYVSARRRNDVPL